MGDRALARGLADDRLHTAALSDFDLGGIVSTPDRRHLLTAQGTTGQLWRIDLRTRQIVEVDLDGARLTNADGIVLRGNRPWVVQNFSRQIVQRQRRCFSHFARHRHAAAREPEHDGVASAPVGLQAAGELRARVGAVAEQARARP